MSDPVTRVAAGGGGAGKDKDKSKDESTPNYDAKNLAYFCLCMERWRFYMNIAINRRVARCLVGDSKSTNEKALAARAIAQQKAEHIVYTESIAGVPLLVMRRLLPTDLVATAKSRFSKRAKTRNKKASVESALRFFLGGSELNDRKTLAEQGVRNGSRITVLFAAADREILENMYKGLYGISWGKSRDRHGWLKPCPIREWAGVSTTPDGEFVLSLSRTRLQIKDTIPSNLGALSRIAHLDLSGNRFRGPIPTELGCLSNIKYLNLSFNRLQGPIPTEFGLLPKDMDTIALQSNRLTGPVPTELVQLAKLRTLGLHSNRLDTSLRQYFARELPRCHISF